MKRLQDKFEERWIPEPFSGCWLWTSTWNPKGYGLISTKRDGKWRMRRAHRVAWELFRSPIPKKLQVLHRCDTPCCVNPDHLFLGSNSDNRMDSLQKGRVPDGERHYGAKLSADDVRQIRASSGTHQTIADRFGVARVTITYIKNRRNWRNV